MHLTSKLLSTFHADFYSTDKPIATVHAATAEDVDAAVQAAKAALSHSSWKLLPATERGQLMGRLADLMEENRELFAAIDAWDNGSYSPPCHRCAETDFANRQTLPSRPNRRPH